MNPLRKFFALTTILAICLGLTPLTTLIAAEQTVDECSKELLLAYFPEAFVVETLKKFNVPQDRWDNIKKGLNSKDKDVIKIVEQKASQMDPNPLKDPQQRQAAVKIFRETLLQIFGDVMRANGITDQAQIQSMLDDVQQQKAKRFAKCMEKQKSEMGDEEEDEDEEEEENVPGKRVEKKFKEKKAIPVPTQK